MGCGVWGLGFGVWGLGFGVCSLVFVIDKRDCVPCNTCNTLGSRVWDLGFRIKGLGFQGFNAFRCRVSE